MTDKTFLKEIQCMYCEYSNGFFPKQKCIPKEMQRIYSENTTIFSPCILKEMQSIYSENTIIY